MLCQINDLTPNSKRITIVVKLISQAEPRYAKGHKVVQFIGSDPTGQIPIPFWNNDCDAVKVGDCIEIQNGYISVYQEQMILNVGKFGSFRCIEPPEEFSISNNPPPTSPTALEISTVEMLERKTRGLAVEVVVQEKVEERTVHTRQDGEEHRVVTYLVGDATGCILLTLWDAWNDQIKVPSTVVIEGAFVRSFRGRRYLTLTKNARIEPSESAITFNKRNNLSETNAGM